MADEKNDGNISNAPAAITPEAGWGAAEARRYLQETGAPADFEIPTPNWGYWTRLDLWPLSPAISLLLEYEPSAQDAYRSKLMEAGQWCYDWALASSEAGKLRIFFDEQRRPSVDPFEWVNWAHEKKIAIPEPLRHLIAVEEKSVTQEKPLSTRNRHTLLTIIAALCKQARIDYSQRGAPQRIKETCEAIGAPVSENTIASVLAEIPDALDSRAK
jgi:hypothetical protein